MSAPPKTLMLGEGATVMGLRGALFGAVHFEHGHITNASSHSCRVPRFPDVPPETSLLDRSGIPFAGAGEAPCAGGGEDCVDAIV